MSEQEIYIEVMNRRDPADRSRYLDKVCAGNDGLRKRVERLIQQSGQLGSFLEHFPHSVVATEDISAGIEQPGTLIGPYKLLEQVGEGGMGVVYVAEQTAPVRRRVALKIIKPGMDTKQVIARFEAERQALAMMDHPHIARVLDAGTTEQGRPYFVMELVRGMPITEYCDKARLNPRQRLALFIDVCQAVQHAHQKGIIHRDLKPSNVMVTTSDGRPVVKVIDFGVVKAIGQQLTERTVYTALTQLVGTPLYMSPEQAELTSNDVDTRSDVYSLGVLLYELLTGQTPFDKERMKSAGFDEMRRIIREEEPPRPSHRISTLGAQASSTLSQQRGLDERHLGRVLRGELDWIVMKALEKDRARRYESASALAADIQRYLSDEPILACPPTAMYRFHKFSRKHKPAIATTAAIALCLLLGTTVSAWQAIRATQAEAQAEANEQKATANEEKASTERDEVKALNEKLAAKEQQLERTLYAAHINLAQHATEEGETTRALSLLKQHVPKPGEKDLRSFEWHYLRRLCPIDLFTLNGHTSRVMSVVYSPDGKRLATASADKTVKVWDAANGNELRTLIGHTSLVKSVVFSPDGSRLASAARDGTVKVWDARTGNQIVSISRLEEGVSTLLEDVAFSPDGKRLLVPFAPAAQICHAETGEPIVTFSKRVPGVLGVEFSPDGNHVAMALLNKTVILWDAGTGEPIHTLVGHTRAVRKVAFSTDGKRLVSRSSGGGDYRDGEILVWDPTTGMQLNQTAEDVLTLEQSCTSPDGRHIAVPDNNSVAIRNIQQVQASLTLGGTPNDSITNIAFSPDGKWLATASNANDPQESGGEAKIWDVKTGKELRNFNIVKVLDLAFSPDGSCLATVSGRGGANEMNMWNAHTGEKLFTLNPSQIGGSIECVAFSPDGKSIACGMFFRGQVKICDARTGVEKKSLQSDIFIGALTFSPDGKSLAAYCNGGPDRGGPIVKVWDLETDRELLSLRGGFGKVAFTNDGKRIAIGGKVWDFPTGREILNLEGVIGNTALSPDGNRLAITSRDGNVKLWNAHSGDELLSFEGHHGYNDVAFSPDGTLLAAGGPNGTIKIYDATPLPEKP